MNRLTQKQMIISYIKDYGSITQMEAITEIGCTRLPSRICELKKDGFNIITEFITIKNRYGSTTRIARYKLDKETEYVG